MNYSQAIDYLLSFADFERSGRFRDRPDVEPVLSLLRRLGDPQAGRRTVHVAGSKGKGSVCAMAEAILRAAGIRTGLYTSPHLHSYTERIQIDGEPIAEQEFARLTEVVRHAVEAEQEALGERQLVTFDLLTALGFLAFREAGIEAQVVEVGLGGRVDSTNVFASKEVAAITPLSLEHAAILGDTVEQIAAEKAAIITPGCTVVIAPQAHEAARQVVLDRAAAAGCRVIEVERDYRWEVLSHGLRGQTVRLARPAGPVEARSPLLGSHQAENAATALACVDALTEKAGWAVPDEAVSRGLSQVRWPGRMEVLREQPTVIADGAHNRDSAQRLREALGEYFPGTRATIIAGASADKDVDGLAQELAPVAERVLAVRADHPRAMEPERIAAAFREAGVPAEIVDSVGTAMQRAMAESGERGLICLVGSLFVAAEARKHVSGVRESAG